MRRVILPAFFVLLLCSRAFGVELKPTIALSPDYQGPGSEFVITWFPLSGKSYNIEAATDLNGPWAALNPQPLVAEKTVETYRDQTAEPVRFYRIRKLDTQPPEVVYLSPKDGAIAVGRSEPLVVRLSDEAGIDPQSISFSVGARSPIGIDDPRLIFSEDFLVYTPAADESYGGYGETVTARLSVSDTLGSRLENYTWSFKLELETVLAQNVILIDDASPLKLISVQGDTYTFSYTGDSPGISVGDILVSTDPANPYKVKVVSLTDHPDSHTVDVLMEPATLPEIFERASFRVGNANPEGEEVLPLSPGWPWTGVIHIEKRLSLDGTAVYEGERLKVEFTSGFIELACDVSIGGEIGWPSLLESFDLDLTGTVGFDATVKATASGEIKRDFQKSIATLPLPPFAVPVLGVPILVTPAVSFDVGMSAEANAQGEITAGIRSSYTLSAGVTMRDGDWTPYRTHSGDASPITPTWNIEGEIELKCYVEVKVAAYVVGLIGPSLSLAPYLEFDGHFQANPLAYDYALNAGVTSDLAIDLSFLDQDVASWRLLDWRRTLAEETYRRGTELKPEPATWSRAFGGAGAEDYMYCVEQTSDGGYVLAGQTDSYGAGGADAWLIKTDWRGTKEWSRTFGGTGADGASSVQQTSDGGFIVAGGTSSFGAGQEDAWLVKTDSRGTEEWSNTFGGTWYDAARWVQQTPDGGYVIAGFTDTLGPSGRDGWLVRTDSRGTQEWSRTFGGSDADFAECVRRASDGGYILAGMTQSSGPWRRDAWLVKTDASGNESWARTFGGSGYQWAYSAEQTCDGGYILAGQTSSFGAGDYDAWLIKTDDEGTTQWTRTFGGASADFASSVHQTFDCGYILAGTTWSFAKGADDAWLIKTDACGNEQWSKTFGGGDYDFTASVRQCSDGGYILAGSTRALGFRAGHAWLIKTDVQGNAAAVSEQPEFRAPWSDTATITQGNNGATSHYDHGSWDNTYALDIALSTGTYVLAPADGTVVYYDPDPAGAGGKELAIEHTGPSGKKFTTVYLHLSEILRTSGAVSQGEVVARSGATGDVTGAHLHFHLWSGEGSFDSHTIPIERLVMKQVGVDPDFREYNGAQGELDDSKIGGKSFQSNNEPLAIAGDDTPRTR